MCLKFNLETLVATDDHLSGFESQVVADKEQGDIMMLTNKYRHHPDFQEQNDLCGHPKNPPFEQPHGLVIPRLLSQVAHRSLSTVDDKDVVDLDGSKVYPTSTGHSVEDLGSNGIVERDYPGLKKA